MLRTRTDCRLCYSPDVNLIYKMPACPPVDNFRSVGEPEISLPNFPMDLYMCQACGHAQLLDVVDPQILYGNYIYTSSSSTDLDRHFTAYADTVSSYLQLKPQAKVLDVGANDGLLLTKFMKLGYQVFGIDPSSYVCNIAEQKGIQTINAFFNETSKPIVIEKFGKFDLVTANNVFSHADDLGEFARCAHDVLEEEGTFVFEVSYLKDLVDNIVIDYVYHEHLCHHSIKPLKQFLAKHGLKLVHVQHMQTKGGSIRCFAVKDTHPRSADPIVEKMIQDELQSGLYEKATYEKLKRKMDQTAEAVRALLLDAIQKGERVASYGASATATVLNAMFDINPFISFIIDDNPLRQQRLSPGFLAPILSSAELVNHQPKYVFIASWRFANEIIKRNLAYLQSGGQFIVPLPALRIVNNQNIEQPETVIA